METLNPKIFLAYPITLIAAIVGRAQESLHQDYEMAAQQITTGYDNLENENIVSLCESPYFEMLSQEELDSLLNYVYSKLGLVRSFTVRKFNNETSEYRLECSNGFFKMILVVNSDSRITAIDFAEEKECYEWSHAA